MMATPEVRACASQASAALKSSTSPLMSKYEQPASRQAARIGCPVRWYGPAASSTQLTRDNAARNAAPLSSGRCGVLRPVSCPSAAQRLAIHQFVDDIPLADIVHGNNVRMIQRRHR